MVDDVIGFSGSNHGTTVLRPSECSDGCPPADWQQIAGSNFIKALNSRAETFAGISYTETYTHTDEVVQPNSGPKASAALHTGSGAITNVATQQICPADLYEHLEIGTIDPVAYALAVDALRHTGPANAARIPRSVCSQLYMPGATPATARGFVAGLPALLRGLAASSAGAAAAGAPVLKAEPPLACYVFATCTGAAAPSLQLSYTTHRSRKQRMTSVRILVRTREGSERQPVPGVTVTLAGHRTLTGSAGTASLKVLLTPERKYRLSATRAGCDGARKTIRLSR